MSLKTGRNELCPCGSGKKYKKCCLNKDREEQEIKKNPINESNLPTLNRSNLPKFGTNMLCEDELFNSKEEIFESIRKSGFVPVIEVEDECDLEDGSDPIVYLQIALVCKHGFSEESRTFDLREDGKWEWVESGFGGDPCMLCGNDSSFLICPVCKTRCKELTEEQIINLYESGMNYLTGEKCHICGSGYIVSE